jgi:hypothetical protein
MRVKVTVAHSWDESKERVCRAAHLISRASGCPVLLTTVLVCLRSPHLLLLQLQLAPSIRGVWGRGRPTRRFGVKACGVLRGAGKTETE